jgi:hypothetical protein
MWKGSERNVWWPTGARARFRDGRGPLLGTGGAGLGALATHEQRRADHHLEGTFTVARRNIEEHRAPGKGGFRDDGIVIRASGDDTGACLSGATVIL